MLIMLIAQLLYIDFCLSTFNKGSFRTI